MRRIVITNAVALLAAALLVVSYLDGWWSDSDSATSATSATTTAATATATRPETEVALPPVSTAWDATEPYPPSTVTLAVGQRLGVRTTGGAMPKLWYLDSTGDGAVLQSGPDFVITPCSTNPPAPGCAPEFDQTFTALGPGTTTLTWAFGSAWACRPDAPDRAELRCDVTKSIQVTVH
ncbi:hypothetical protein ABTY61_28920 [Kitasatospora sp. NPDC096128]|uniref:hypothetical protein n=1 Tax=Kitasatospora sp. NPDC096128 TaxID=3155547 RepID=UPI00331B5568